MTFAFSDIPALSGKTAIVTGSNTGIGLEIARALSRKGARVVLACRDADKANAAIANISQGAEQADLDYLHLDLANIASVRDTAEEAKQEKRVDLLINNAGVMIPPLGHGSTGAELQFQVNHLGHFAFTGLLLDKLAQNDGARVITQASIAHRGAAMKFDNLDASQGYSRNAFYGQSKLANLLFAFELDRRLRAANSPIKSVAAHPGIAQTEITRHLGVFGNLFGATVGTLLNSSEQGALPALQAATDPGVEGGEYFGPYGFREMSGTQSGPAVATKTAQDPLLAARLWAKSVEMTGVDPQLAPV